MERPTRSLTLSRSIGLQNHRVPIPHTHAIARFRVRPCAPARPASLSISRVSRPSCATHTEQGQQQHSPEPASASAGDQAAAHTRPTTPPHPLHTSQAATTTTQQQQMDSSLARTSTTSRRREEDGAGAAPATGATAGSGLLGRQANIFLGQTAAAVIASSVVSPAMTVIDLSIIRAQFEKSRMTSALKNTTADILGGRMRATGALSIMSTVYTSTYLTANYTAAACKELDIDYKVPTAVATSLVNMSVIAWKDREFARMMSKEPAVFPLASYGLFALRDGLTVTSSFVLKNSVRDKLVEEHGMTHRNADLAASFAVPMLAQLFSTPLHILSLDLYSRPDAPMRLHMQAISKGYASVCSGRVLRIIPAFGVGGFLNDVIKESWAEKKGL